eukprot:5972336-Pleurochrysis_carterae.AAC.2
MARTSSSMHVPLSNVSTSVSVHHSGCDARSASAKGITESHADMHPPSVLETALPAVGAAVQTACLASNPASTTAASPSRFHTRRNASPQSASLSARSTERQQRAGTRSNGSPCSTSRVQKRP